MAQARTDLERFFHPDGVAVLGRVARDADPDQLIGQHRERYGTDRVFLVRDMPEVVEHLHYRVIDVSTIKELSRRWFTRAYFQAPAKHGGHRALGDIRDSIDELRYYRQAVFAPAPGPDTATAREISAQISAAPESAAPTRNPNAVPQPSLW